MHILFIHQNYPAQFGHVARYLVQRKGFRCTFLSQHAPGADGGVERIQYLIRSGASAPRPNTLGTHSEAVPRPAAGSRTAAGGQERCRTSVGSTNGTSLGASRFWKMLLGL